MAADINLTLQEVKMCSALEDFRKAAHLPEGLTKGGMLRAVDGVFRHIENARKVLALAPTPPSPH